MMLKDELKAQAQALGYVLGIDEMSEFRLGVTDGYVGIRIVPASPPTPQAQWAYDLGNAIGEFLKGRPG